MSSISYITSDFDAENIRSFSVKNKKWTIIPSYSNIYSMLLSYIANNLVSNAECLHDSYGLEILPSRASCEYNEEEFDEISDEVKNGISSKIGRISYTIGYGEYKFKSIFNENEEYYAIHQHVGKPVGGNFGVEWMSNLIIFTENSLESLAEFLNQLLNINESTRQEFYSCFIWQVNENFWLMEGRNRARKMDSVLLPMKVKERVLKDIERFLSPGTKDFYIRNGIPYRRSYLFHGIPGTGKTSFIKALAGYFNRNVCFLIPTHPNMTDDRLRNAINQIPNKAIVVFEDIDSLFTRNRTAKVAKSSLTFSGLLNALDGISSTNGQIFVLTTNLRDELDPALIRAGRVDMHVEFTFAVEEQMMAMWKNFYPDHGDLAEEFAHSVRTLLDKEGYKITTSTLQQFFIAQMYSTAEEALRQIHTIVDEIKEHTLEDKSVKQQQKKGKEKSRRERRINKVNSIDHKVGDSESSSIRKNQGTKEEKDSILS